MLVVVDGIDTREQVGYLMAESYTPLIQGFYFAKPMKPADLVKCCCTYRFNLGNKQYVSKVFVHYFSNGKIELH